MQIKVFIFVLALFLFLCNNRTQGQENYFTKTLTTENGLPHNHVQSITQDSTGFLWVATWDGLCRYDGYEFRNYFHNPADSTSLAYFICNKVLVDYQNNVWVYGGGGISKYNRAMDNFTQFLFNIIGGITLDKEGKFWCSTDDGLKKWDYQKNKFETLKTEFEKLPKNWEKLHPAHIAFDNENQLWFCANYEDKSWLFRCKPNNDDGIIAELAGTLDNNKYFPTLSVSWNFEIVAAHEKDYLIFGNMNVFRYDSLSKEFLPADENPETTKNKIVKKSWEKQKYYKPELTGLISVAQRKTGFMETFFLDNQKTLWQGILTSGTIQTGLTRSIPTPRGFKHYFTGLNPESGLNAFFPVLKDKNGTVWGGATNVNKIFLHDKNGAERQITPIDDETWQLAKRPRAMLEDSTGIWIGYFQSLLLHFDYLTTKFSKVILKKEGTKDTSEPRDFVHLKKLGDSLLIVGFNDIFKINIKTKLLTKLKSFDGYINMNMYSVTRDISNGWWIGGNESRIFHYDDNFNEIAVYKLAKGLFNVEDIVVGDNNDLWVSMLGAGLAHFDKTTGKTKIYTTANGLSNNTCYGMQKDKNGNIWVSTNHGISRFNPKTMQLRVFGPEDGLKIDEFNSDNSYLAPDGEMFFAGMGGIVSFYPDSISENSLVEKSWPLVFTDFKVSGENRYFKKALYESDSIILNNGDDNFQLTFACLDFKNSAKIKYRYRLLPSESKFITAGFNHRNLNYSSLSPGTYRLEVEATNVNGEWASPKALIIKIPPFYYQTPWFKMLVAALVILIVVYFVYTYNRQIRLKARQQQDELKLESLRGQMNPHFIFNSLNSINYFISQNDRLSANRYISDFSRLIRSFLGNLSSDYIPLEKEIESLKDYLQLEHLRFGDKFEYEIEIGENVKEAELMVFPGMVQPFIENAIWHGVRGLEHRKGNVKVIFKLGESGDLKCLVEDDGIGRKLAESRKSNLPGKTSRGIGIVLERLKIINHLRNTNFQIVIEDLYPEREETGTLVIVDIPVKS